MTDYSGMAKANREFDMHTHAFPDGSMSTAHCHANGDVAHQHMINLVGGFWMIDYGKDPMLLAGAQVGHGQPVQAQAPHQHAFQPDPPMHLPSAKAAINQTNPSWPVGFKVYFEAGSLLPPGFVWEDDLVYGSPTTAPEPKKSRADLIWEAIQGASKA